MLASKEFRSLTCILVFHLVLVGWFIYNQSMWRDELQAWNIVRASSSLFELWDNLSYEGHPPLWYALIFYIQKVLPYPEAMQFLNHLFMTFAVVLILFKSSFSLLEKVLIVFGFFFVYEYAIKSRNYALTVFFLLLANHAYVYFRKTPHWYFLCLLGAASSHLLGGIFLLGGGSLALIGCHLRKWQNVSTMSKTLSWLSYLLGILVIIDTAILPSDAYHPWTVGLFKEFELGRILTTISRFGLVFLNPDIADQVGNGLFQSSELLLSVALIAGTVYLIKSDRYLLLFFLSNLIGLFLFFYLKFALGRHFGFLFILFLSTLWQFRQSEGWVRKKDDPNKKGNLSFETIFQMLIYFVLFFLLFRGIEKLNSLGDVPLSAAKATASYIQRQLPEDISIVATSTTFSSGIGAYLGRRIFFLDTQSFVPFKVWRRENHEIGNLSTDTLSLIPPDLKRPILLIGLYPAETAIFGPSLRHIGNFTEAGLNEQFSLFLLGEKADLKKSLQSEME